MTSPRVILSGGGTGGHIFPAVSIAQEIRRRYPDAQVLFIGALGRMEMEKIPQAGFEIVGLNIAGFDRGNLLSNFKLPFKLLSSLSKAKKVIKAFQPDFVVGTGGYASGPALWAASRLGIPTFVQEQNAIPGVTNKLLSKKAKAVFTAYPDMEKLFPHARVYYFGNPIRQNLLEEKIAASKAKEKLGLEDKLTILSVGGSLGSRAINNAWKNELQHLQENNYQLLWQTGKLDYPSLKANQDIAQHPCVHLKEFIKDMATAYAAADVIVSRAGAIAISELQVMGKPVLLVPLPTAAEDHQTRNAQSLVDKKAAFMVKDADLKEQFWKVLQPICSDSRLREEMSAHLLKLGKPEATKNIVNEIFKIIEVKN